MLHPSGAIYWPEQQKLLIADVHLGKVSHFRKHGAAIPPEAAAENYRKLNEVMAESQPETICFLGDLFHSYINTEWNVFIEWVGKQKKQLILIKGNHDIISDLKFEDVNMEVRDSLQIGKFLLTHHPVSEANFFNFAGHLHPGVRMVGKGRQGIRLSCFYRTTDQLILPAFGNFTGKHIIRPGENDEVYVIVSGEVIFVT